MTLLAFLPAAVAMLVFLRILSADVPVTTQVEREAVASSARGYRVLAVTLLALPLIVVAALHLAEGGWVPLRLS